MKILILCDGDPPSEALFTDCIRESELFIAADGGANFALEQQVKPDYVIGDLDSFEHIGEAEFQLIHEPEQETNDLEKALNLARIQGAAEVTVLGATGERLDHTLKNLSVLKKYNPHFNDIIFKDNFGDTFLIPKEYKANWPVGTIISLFPLSGIVKGITTRGLKYPLDNEDLENGVRDGSSNITTESSVAITYRSGDLILYIVRDDNRSCLQ